MKRILRKTWSWFFLICLLLFVAIQFIGPSDERPPVTSVIQLPDSVQQILVKSCFDCHSSMTKYSWFDQISPASWIVQNHVRQGRKRVNFSQWDSLTRDQQKVVLFESLNQMQFQIMPPVSYSFVHPPAGISRKELQVFRNYLEGWVHPYSPDTVKINAWKEQYARWIARDSNPEKSQPAPNGIVLNTNYKNWVAISSTERFDNGTMRVIVGNDIAVKAAREGLVNPWPDGTEIVKILWISVVDSGETIHPGFLRQLDYMIKDRTKYAKTAGWGFARWVDGLALRPYGKDALFASECVRCHQSMQKNDFVFTEPVNLKTSAGLEGRVIASWIDPKNGSMSTLYGNSIAAAYIRSHPAFDYPAGSELTLATWKQKEDAHWFGARIPDARMMIEQVYITDSPGGERTFRYERHAGPSWGKISDQSTEVKEMRTSYIISRPASVMP